MKNNEEFFIPAVPVLQGKIEHARYEKSPLQDYNGNPLIEALPAINTVEQTIMLLNKQPIYDERELELDETLRMHCVQRLASLVIPLSTHIDVEQSLSRIIRHGYLTRNPLDTGFSLRLRLSEKSILNQTDENIGDIHSPVSKSSGFVILGFSGIGKTTTVEQNLLLYPQVIIHNEYAGKKMPLFQIVWLKLECPHDGSPKSLCLNFFQAVDSIIGSNYFEKYKHYTTNTLIPKMARIACLHCLGVLVIDEIQNLKEAKKQGSEVMLNFFVQLVNTIGVPMVLVGTPKAAHLINSTFRNARRGTGQGDKIWERLSPDAPDWQVFLNGLWQYQWVKRRIELSDTLAEVMYEESQGIIDIAVKLFMLTQWRAIATGKETITPQLIHSVAIDSLKLVRPALQALKSGKQELINKYDDLSLPIEEMEKSFNKAVFTISTQKQTEVQNTQTENHRKITEVFKWLTEAGVEPQKAFQTANQIVNEFPEEDVKNLKAKAFAISQGFLEHETEPKVIPLKKKDKKEAKIGPQIGGLLAIVAAGRKRKIPPYEALLQAGYIKNSSEFLKGDIK